MTPARTRRVLTLPGWWSTVGEAERAAGRVIRVEDVRSACTHALDGIAVVTVELMPGVDVAWAAHASPPGRIGHLAEIAHENRWSGRAFVFEGQAGLDDRTTVEQVLRRTTIDDVVLAGRGVTCAPGVPLVGARWLRPVYRDGRLVLTVRPGGEGAVIPLEQPPTAVPGPRLPGQHTTAG